MAGTGRKDPWIRWFDVTSPKKHTGGYTIYKVTSKVFPVHSPEATTEIVVWKRYKDINKLHKTLSLVHRNLHRPGVFPDFPKPRIFGRFDDDIIEERRLAALELLNFVGSQAHLFNSLAVQEFFETSESCEGEKPSHDQNILQPVSVAPSPDNSAAQEEEAEPNTDTSQEEPAETTQEGEGLRGDSSETVGADQYTASDPVGTGNVSIGTVNELAESLSGIWAHRHEEDSDAEQSDSEGVTSQSTADTAAAAPQFSVGGSDLEVESSNIMEEFDPCRDNSGVAEQSAGVSNVHLLSQCVDGPTHTPHSTQPPINTEPELAPPSDTLGEYIQSKEDYLYKAVKQIHRAKKEEQASHYQIAFDYYKRAVALLLTGVQGENDEGRRSVVKRKTAEYLVYAEHLHNRYLDSSGTDGDRWKQLQVPRSVARLRDGLSELANYKVLGLVGKNMLVLDKHTEQTYVIKVLQKNSEVTEASWSKQIIPTKCTRMVKLVKYFETESTIYLLLDYTQGMTLWQYVYNYLHGSSRESSPRPLLADGADNIYSGKKYTSSVSDESKTSSATPEGSKPTDAKEYSQEYLDMLLGVGLKGDESVSEPSILSDEGDMKAVSNADDTGVQTEPRRADDVFIENSSVTLPRKDSVEETVPLSTRRNIHVDNDDKVSLRRSNSSLNRSVSVERASDTVTSSRHRNWSTVFDDLETSTNQKHSRPHLPESCVQRWAAELLAAIQELHQCGLILRDLKPDNILLNSRGHIILTYFCQWPGVREELSSKSKEHFHVSPEGTLPGALCLASDYWSFGVILYELLSGVSLSNAHPEGITSHTILRTPDHLSQEAEHLLKQLLRYNWRERLGGAAGVEEIKAHPFFSSIDWSTV